MSDMGRKHRVWQNTGGPALAVVPPVEDGDGAQSETTAPRILRATTRVLYADTSMRRVLALPGDEVDPCPEDRDEMLAKGLAK